jgi:hypothetical protein
MKRTVEASWRFVGPCWFAVALLGIEADELVGPVLGELHARLTSGTVVSRSAHVECSPITRAGGAGTMTVHWRDARHPDAFPTMSGELRLVEVDKNLTELRLVGEYEPPLGVLGAVGDAVAGHRVVQSTFDELAERLARRIEAVVAEHTGTAPSPRTEPPSEVGP